MIFFNFFLLFWEWELPSAPPLSCSRSLFSKITNYIFLTSYKQLFWWCTGKCFQWAEAAITVWKILIPALEHTVYYIYSCKSMHGFTAWPPANKSPLPVFKGVMLLQLSQKFVEIWGGCHKNQALTKKLSATGSLSVSTDLPIQISKYTEIYLLWQCSLPTLLSSHLWMTLCPTLLMGLYPVLLQDTDIILVLSAMLPPAIAFLIILIYNNFLSCSKSLKLVIYALEERRQFCFTYIDLFCEIYCICLDCELLVVGNLLP